VTTERQQELRQRFIDARGFWNSTWESLLELDASFFEAFLDFSAVPWRKGALEPKIKEFIYIAVDAAGTGPYEPGLRQHIRKAIEYGATKEELLEVLELTSTLGIHACNIGVPLLLDVLRQAGKRTDAPPLTERQERLKTDFEANRGYWHEFWDGLLELDPDFFEAYLEFSSVPWKHGVLEPKVKEFIYTAFDVAATHLYVPGLRLHLENAVGLGATAEELMELFEIASVLGMRACAIGVPILLEELAAAEAAGAGAMKRREGRVSA
jgi:alkylhydroperoxidase/carboxymuconolactone decarboxylase family protein YurZ